MKRWEELKAKSSIINKVIVEDIDSDTKKVDDAYEVISKVEDNLTYTPSEKQLEAIKNRMTQIIDNLEYKDTDNDESELERIARIMDLMDWKYFGSKDRTKPWEILKTLEGLFDNVLECLKKGYLTVNTSTGGWCVRCNILRQTLEAYFCLYDSELLDYND